MAIQGNGGSFVALTVARIAKWFETQCKRTPSHVHDAPGYKFLTFMRRKTSTPLINGTFTKG